MSEQQEKKEFRIDIALSDLKFLNFETTTRVQELKKQLKSKEYEFHFEFQSKFKKEEKLVNLILTITANEKQNESTKIELAKMQLSITFLIANFDDVITIKENNIATIPNELIALTAGIAVASARGMFAVNVQNTVISNAIVPIVDPRIFVPKKKEE